MKLQLGTGDNFLSGYENTDIHGVDLRRPLPYENESAEIIVAAHVLEILLFREVPFAMQEIYRVLKKSGWVRFHFGLEKMALSPIELIETLELFSRNSLWQSQILDKETTKTGDEEILKCKGQHGPSIVIEMQKL